MHQNRIPESELVLNPDGSVYHLHLKGSQVADNIILVGDPGRVSQVADFFETVDFKVANREFVTITGRYRDQRFTVLSTGIGTDNIDIVLNELDAAVNIDLESRLPRTERKRLNLVRIGTSGSMHSDIPVDSYVLSAFGLGFDGLIYYYNYQYTEIEKEIMSMLNKHLNWNSNLSTPYLISADAHLAKVLGHDMHPGITATATGFYGPQGRQLRIDLRNKHMHHQFQSFHYRGQRITNFEMETSALYGLGKLLGHRCCTCCAIIANRVSKEYSKDYKPVIDNLIQLVLDRMSGMGTMEK
jgi:uridine phosphorylase